MSLGGVGFAGAVRDAIRTAVESGMIVMAAAGNEVGFVTAPASWPECLAIGGIGITDAPWPGSSHGREVDFCAPAEDVWVATARRENGRAVFTVEPHDGTSFAVANTAGRRRAVARPPRRRDTAPSLRPENVQRLFLTLARRTARTPDDWDSRSYGAGILDAGALLEASLPDPAAFARRRTRATATTVAALDRLARCGRISPDTGAQRGRPAAGPARRGAR